MTEGDTPDERVGTNGLSGQPRDELAGKGSDPSDAAQGAQESQGPKVDERGDAIFDEKTWRAVIKQHAPEDFDALDSLLEAIRRQEILRLIVMATDIRKSTTLMKEAVDLVDFASDIGTFVNAMRSDLRRDGGWFDKFTGDGYLAYWIYESYDDFYVKLQKTLLIADETIGTFEEVVIPRLRANSRNFPRNAGLSIGIDSGPAQLVNIAGDLTVVGQSVVGAVRMVNAATEPSETVLNVYLGELLERSKRSLRGVAAVRRDYRPTKEYPDGQEVYFVDFPPRRRGAL